MDTSQHRSLPQIDKDEAFQFDNLFNLSINRVLVSRQIYI